MPSADIRRIQPDEAELYMDIRLEMLKEHPESFGDSYPDASQRPIDFYRERVTDSYIVGAFDQAKIVGTAGYFIQKGKKAEHKAYLWGVYTTKDNRGQGISRKLSQRVLDDLPEHIELIQTCVVKGNDTAHEIYKELGFQEYGVEEKGLKVDGKYYDEILMVKFLK
ncbi:MAG: GNAT family N-acetyltransferase [Pseudomonadota bacterium]